MPVPTPPEPSVVDPKAKGKGKPEAKAPKTPPKGGQRGKKGAEVVEEVPVLQRGRLRVVLPVPAAKEARDWLRAGEGARNTYRMPARWLLACIPVVGGWRLG